MIILVFVIALHRSIHAEVSCASLTILKNQLGEQSAPICRHGFNVLAVVDEKSEVIACLQVLPQNAGVEKVICENTTLILNIVENLKDEEIVLRLLKLVTQVRTPALLSRIEPNIAYFVELLGGHKVRIACAGAECLRVIAKERQDLIEPYSEAILKVLS
jgi:hypothetical protein